MSTPEILIFGFLLGCIGVPLMYLIPTYIIEGIKQIIREIRNKD